MAPPPRRGAAPDDFSSLFDFLPVGAYRSTPDGRQLRANPALVRLNGYTSEADQLASVRDIATQWYVRPDRRDEFKALLERDGSVTGFESEVRRADTGARFWVRENAHRVCDAKGRVLFYEGTVEEITGEVRSRETLRRSREQLLQIVDLVPGVIYRVLTPLPQETRVAFISPNVLQLFGVTAAQVLCDPDLISRLRVPEDRERVRREIDAASAERRPLDVEYRIVRPDGQQRWVQQTNCIAPPEDGAEVRVGLMLDITARKQAEAALLENSQLWKRALESTGDGVWDWNLQTGEGGLSPQCLALYGYSAEEMSGGRDRLEELTHPDDVPAMLQARHEHLQGHSSAYVNEHRVRCKDGQYKWILSRGVVISRDAEGRALRIIGTHTDITARKHAEALRVERDRAAAADLAKSQFLSRVSHELRTPLNAILGFAQLLELELTGNERQRAWLAQVLASGRHLLALMNDILDLSSVQTGQLPLQTQQVALHRSVVQALDMLAASAREAGVTVHNEVPDDDALCAHADARRLMQIVGNLLSNAVKYNRRGGWVRVRARREGGEVELSVADSGPGMPPEQVARLFNPFERLDAQRGSIPGTGLGLALSSEFAQAMGGRIAVHSVPGEGSSFTVRLPAA